MAEAQHHTALPLHHNKEEENEKSHSQQEDKATSAAPRTTAWMPNFNRRQSWNAQDHKHQMHLAAVDGIKPCPGFTES